MNENDMGDSYILNIVSGHISFFAYIHIYVVYVEIVLRITQFKFLQMCSQRKVPYYIAASYISRQGDRLFS